MGPDPNAAVLLLERPQPPGIEHLKTAELRFPLGERDGADPVTAARFRRRHANLLLLQNHDDPLFAKPASFHFGPTPLRRTLQKPVTFQGSTSTRNS